MAVKKNKNTIKQSARKAGSLGVYKKFVEKKLSHLTPYLQGVAMGDFSKKIKISKEEDEFTELAVLINIMIEDLQEAKKEVNKKTQLHGEIIENMTDGVYMVGLKDVKIKYANSKFENMFGYEPGEMIGKHASIVNAPTDKDPQEIAKEIMGVIKKTGKWQGEVNNIKKDGTSFWSRVNVSVFDHLVYGKVLIAIHADITEKKKVEEKLKNIYNLSQDFICIANKKGYFEYVNPAMFKKMGYSEKEMLSKPFLDFIHPEDHHKNDKEVAN